MSKRCSIVQQSKCVSCGTCLHFCPRNAITIIHGTHAQINKDLCIGCGLCKKECPADAIYFQEREAK